jgi:subtilisin family serine protease
VFAVFAFPPRSGAHRSAQQTKSSVKRSGPKFVPGEVLVRYRNEAVAKAESNKVRTLSLENKTVPVRIERLKGADIVPGLRLARVEATETETLAAIAALKRRPDVLYAEPNYIWKADRTPNDPRFISNELYGLSKINAPVAWDTTTGSSGVVVGIVDEGVDIAHPDLTANIWTNPDPGSIPGISGDLHGYDFVAGSGTIPANQHATHVAGTVGATGDNGTGVVGVNWAVRLMSLRTLGPLDGDVADAVSAYSYAKQMRELWVSSGGTRGANIRVLNNSYGGTGFSQSAFDAIEQLNQAGILFVASAGNIDDGNTNNDVTPHYPSDYYLPNVISVAATDQNDQIPLDLSHVGQNTVHLGAPGEGILSTLPGSAYATFSGTSMAAPHVSGSAALLWAHNPSLSVQQVKSLLIFNGDQISDLVPKTVTGRRLNIANSFTVALTENDPTPPGTVVNLHRNTQNGRNLNISWVAAGDDGAGGGRAALYEVDFLDSETGEAILLKRLEPASPGSGQSLDVKIPFYHQRGSIRVHEYDNVGNLGVSATLPVTVNIVDADPYAPTLGFTATLSTGGTPLGFDCDDCYETDNLPFIFSYFGQGYNTVKISSNGNLYFEPPSAPTDGFGTALDAFSFVPDLAQFRMISGLWDDIDLRVSSRANADVYKIADANRVIYRWQGVPCNFNGNVCAGGAPINFEIELGSDGTIKSRYGAGNEDVFPVVGISSADGGLYVIDSHTSEFSPIDLTNAPEITYIPRATVNPYDQNFFFISQQYRDLLNREPDTGGLGFWTSDLNSCGNDQICLIRRRVGISAAFFIELEFQRTGSFVYRAFKGGLDRRPSYAEFTADRPLIVEGPNLEQTKQDYMLAFVQRPAFTTKYAGLNSASQFVDALIATIQTTSGVDLNGSRQALIDKYNTGGGNQNLSRALATRDAIDATAFQNAEFNRAFVLMQYYGYLRRDVDQDGYDFWLSILNNVVPGNFQSMVCAFITSAEYQQRFSNFTPHSNSECGPPAF